LSEDPKIAEPSTTEYITKNRIQVTDEAIHNWYRFVLGYPPHLVREYLKTLEANPERDWVFDPFCGTATTPVEARLQGYSTLSVDANPISILAAKVKLEWDVDLGEVQSRLNDILELSAVCLKRFELSPIPDENYQISFWTPHILRDKSIDTRLASEFDPDTLLSPQAAALIPGGFISLNPLLRVLAVRYAIENIILKPETRDFMRLALANTIVKTAGNIGFGPEVYRLPPHEDADVLGAFTTTVTRMVSDLREVLDKYPKPFPPAYVFRDDARILSTLDGHPPIGIIITSPPYPNEKDYTRSTRLESVLLGFIASKEDLRALKSLLLRSNTRNVFINDNDDTYIKDIPAVIRVAEEIEKLRLQLGKTSGFERLYHRVTRLYFGGMYRHLATLLPRLRPGACCAYVVGDQMSYFRVHIPTAQLLADVAVKAGYCVEGIQLWRTRRSTVTGLDLAENVLILKKPDQGTQNATEKKNQRKSRELST
jgi:hypothetical protein